LVVGRDGGVTPFSVPQTFDGKAPPSGGAGMAGMASDVMRLLKALRGDFLSRRSREAAFANRWLTCGRGHVFRPSGDGDAEPVATGTVMPVGSVDWGGSWGHDWVVKRQSGTVIVVCTNTLFEGCNGVFREEVVAAGFG
jgi:CubicO group peptidase (beta-lactamase class C family)